MSGKNNRKNYKILIFAVCLILIVTTFAVLPTALADVGNNNRYDSSSSSSYSSSSDDGGLISILIYLLFDLVGPIPGIIIIIIGVLVWRHLKKTGKLSNISNNVNNIRNEINSSINGSSVINSVGNTVEEIRATDPAFSSDAFVGWVREVFMKIQQAWTERNWKVIRPFESNELFSQHAAQLQEYIDNKKINVIEKIAIKYCEIKEYRVDGDKEVLVVELHAIMRDYVIDADTKKVLESDPNKDWFMKYRMTFNRKVGVKTVAGTSNKSTTNCPNCGAPTAITSAGQCEYCDSVITTGEHDWVLSDISSIN